MAEFRLLNVREVNARVNQVFKTPKWTGVSILLYKDARVDMALLDEVYGANNWQVGYCTIGTSLFCQIDVWDAEKKMWISKMSNGTESNMEAEKGQASDAFKRAGFMWGLGRELYTAPDIMVTLSDDEVYADEKTKKWKTNVKFTVDEISYNQYREISHLVISKQYKGKSEVCFTWNEKVTKPKPVTKTETTEKPQDNPKPQVTTDTAKKENLVIGSPDASADSWKIYYTELKKLCPDEEQLKRICKENGVDSAKKLNGFYFNAIRNILEA